MNGLHDAGVLFRENCAAAERIHARLQTSIGRVAPLFPLDATRLEALDENATERIDALLKRFEQLEDIVDNRIHRGILLLERERLSEMSRRDVADRLEKLGAIASSDRWWEIAGARHRLVHEYPLDAERRAERLNGTFRAAIALMGHYVEVMQWARGRGHLL